MLFGIFLLQAQTSKTIFLLPMENFQLNWTRKRISRTRISKITLRFVIEAKNGLQIRIRCQILDSEECTYTHATHTNDEKVDAKNLWFKRDWFVIQGEGNYCIIKIQHREASVRRPPHLCNGYPKLKSATLSLSLSVTNMWVWEGRAGAPPLFEKSGV